MHERNEAVILFKDAKWFCLSQAAQMPDTEISNGRDRPET